MPKRLACANVCVICTQHGGAGEVIDGIYVIQGPFVYINKQAKPSKLAEALTGVLKGGGALYGPELRV